jgi:hypothetical protein
MFFIYMTYTLLALHVEECTVSGLLLGFTQVTIPFKPRDPLNKGKRHRVGKIIDRRPVCTVIPIPKPPSLYTW